MKEASHKKTDTVWFHPHEVPRVVKFIAAKLLQSCLTLCDPIDGSPPGSPVPGILQARILEWVAISFSNAWKWKVKVKSLSRVRLLATPWTAAHQALRPWDFPGKGTGVGCCCLLRKFIEAEVNDSSQGLGRGGENGSWSLMGKARQRVLEMDVGNSHTTLWMYLIPLHCILKNYSGGKFQVMCISVQFFKKESIEKSCTETMIVSFLFFQTRHTRKTTNPPFTITWFHKRRDISETIKKNVRGLSWWSSGWESIFQCKGTQVESTVRELRPHMPQGN